ncbi:hypothetical protein HZZ02_05805 [Streptococcus danieliae]|nr:hypothetical protein [Streptococcus danieliae]
MTDFNQNFDRELGWEDEITVDSKGFIELQPGDYQFTVVNVERGRHTPNPQNQNAKLPACNKATVTVEIETAEGSKSIKHDLFLHTSTEWMLSAFFGAIGKKKHGEPLRMNWNILGAKGVARIGKRQGTGNYADQKFDDIKSMIYADDVDWTKVLNANVQPSAPQVPVPPQQPQVSQQAYQQPQQAMPQAPVQPQAPQQGSFFEGNTTNIPPQQAMPQQPQAPTSGGFGGF